MMKIVRSGAVAALALLATAGQAAQTVKPQPCLTTEETRALFLAVAPAVIRSVSETCTKVLPAGSYLAAHGTALADRYVAPAAAAKPVALVALNKISGENALPPDMFDMVADAMVGELAVSKIKPKDCAGIDRALTLLDPLPPENFAGLVALIVEFASADEKKPSAFAICKPAA